ncbi:hypothetical protein DPMN_132698 [Dreissena polymorpha]|uniref:Uncharacterized protein n=1 Tax=Dreissena polymorpha TaxID=45954 RepID=A0A9D4FSY5_DREPO|nr:hypothetical protein DPMN_132698 [Dreissena polymorpha]
MTLLYSAEQRLVVLQYQLQVDVHIRSRLTSYAKFVDGSLKINPPTQRKKGIENRNACCESKTTEEVQGLSAQHGRDSEAQGQELMPKSLDAAQMDFGIWGILKRRLQNRHVNSLSGLKRALKDDDAN